MDYERKLNKEENQAYLRIQMKLLEQMKPLSDKMMKAEAEGDTKRLAVYRKRCSNYWKSPMSRVLVVLTKEIDHNRIHEKLS